MRPVAPKGSVSIVDGHRFVAVLERDAVVPFKGGSDGHSEGSLGAAHKNCAQNHDFKSSLFLVLRICFLSFRLWVSGFVSRWQLIRLSRPYEAALTRPPDLQGPEGATIRTAFVSPKKALRRNFRAPSDIPLGMAK